MKIKHSYAVMALLIYTILFAITYIWILPASPQNVAYHDFADARHLFGIDNFFNVVSNIGFILAGCWGIYLIFTYKRNTTFINASERWPYFAFFISAVLVGFGSGFYHFNPNNSTILWDRLPMSITAAAYFSTVFTERVNRKFSLSFMIPLIIIAMLSTVWWEFTEIDGHGDLRIYSWTQTYLLSMMILILLLFPARYTKVSYIFMTLGLYAVAKVFEYFDVAVYNFTHQIISGHVIKHLTAAVGMYFVGKYIMCRKALRTE
jgi:hypothetical protein